MVPLVRVQNVGKEYIVPEGSRPSVSQLFGRKPKGVRSKRALRDVSLQVEAGEAVALIGRNGSGKSTLLKLIAGLSDPTEGRVEVDGEIGTLIDLGVGFHPEFTGRENIRFAGLLRGLEREAVDEMEAKIIEFSGIGDFIDKPLRTYSSGMAVRLGFSVSTAMNPDLLVIDEVLAVGDTSFQLRCYERMEQYLLDGGTILFVSHDMGAVQRMCPRAIWLDNGVLRADGRSIDVARDYDDAFTKSAEAAGDARMTAMMKGTGEARIDEVEFFGPEDRDTPCTTLQTDQPFSVRVRFTVMEPLPELAVAIALYRSDGLVLTQETNSLSGYELRDLEPGSHVIEMNCEALMVQPCSVSVSVTLVPELSPTSNLVPVRYDLRSRAWTLEIISAEEPTGGAFTHPVDWTRARPDSSST